MRSFTAAETRLLYATADEADDFGGPHSAIRVAVAQVSPIAGPGEPARALLPVTGT